MRLKKTISEILNHPHPLRRTLASLNNSPFRHIFVFIDWILNFRQAVRRSSTDLNLSEAERTAVDDLKKFGYVRLTGLAQADHLDRLAQYADWAALNRDKFKLENKTKKSFWTELVEKKDGRFAVKTDHPLAQFALQEAFVRIAAGYLQTIPILNYCLLTLSEHSPEKFGYSQLWHLDRDNINILKIFVYLTDVSDPEDGPFTFVNAKESRKVKNSFFLRHLGDNDFFDNAKADDVIQMLGSRYEIFAVDTTRCYHMGSRVGQGRARVMYTALYEPFISPYFPTRKDPHFRQVDGLTAEQGLLFRSSSGDILA